MGRPSAYRVIPALAGAVMLLSADSASAKSDEVLEAEAAVEFARIKASAPLVTDRETIDYIACVANNVVQALDPEYRDRNWEMAIVEADMVNAFVMPGGKIVIFEGLLNVAEDPNQLAAVIGHEIAHETAKHTRKEPLKGRVGQVGIAVAAVLLGGGHYGATYTAQEALTQGAIYGLMLPYRRKDEVEADVIGLEFMARAGFDPRAAVPLWKNMSASSGGEEQPEFLSTHPSDAKRIDSLVSEYVKVLPLYNQAREEGRIPNCIVPIAWQKQDEDEQE